MNEATASSQASIAKSCSSPTRLCRTRRLADLFVLDDQMHMVRSSVNGPHVFLAFVQGATAAAGSQLQEEPVPAGRSGRRPRPAVGGARPEARRRWRSTPSRCTSAALSRTSTSTARSRSACSAPPRSASSLPAIKGRPPQNYTESQQVVNLTARQTAAIRNFVNRISGSQRMLAHGQLSRRAQPRVHGAADPGEPSGLVEGLQHRLRRQGRRRSGEPDAPLAARRREGRVPTYELITRHREQLDRHPGFFNICIHKGFSPSPVDTPEMGNPIDIPKASRDWPHFAPSSITPAGAEGASPDASGARRHAGRPQLPERRAQPAVAAAVRPDLRPAGQRLRRDRLDFAINASPGRRCARTSSGSS